MRTPTISATSRGTEFTVEVDENGTTLLTMLDGVVEMKGDKEPLLVLTNGQQGLGETGKAPVQTRGFFSVNTIQWVLYYPGVLNPDELNLLQDEQAALRESLAAYRSGDLLTALAKYPANRQPTSNEEKIYRAAVLLSVGQVEEAQRLIQSATTSPNASDRTSRLGNALEKVIAAVKVQRFESKQTPQLATEWMAESYYQQSQGHLPEARKAAENAANIAPNFGFALERFAEMQFGFGNTRAAQKAVQKSLEVSPRNPQALALLGFLSAAVNHISEATVFFNQALAIDSGLPSAWLGLGLCHIRQGSIEKGREELQVAATLEPQRALYRSYLGKAWSQEWDTRRALHELQLAKELDPYDPTAYLYSALVEQQDNQINAAVRDLETSQAYNENRRIYRSKQLLDKDLAVRGANLASVYQDAGMPEVSVREAVRAVNTDYANFSAHLFLAESYSYLRDPHLVDLRYETPWVNEYLVANLLADPRAGTLSPYVTEQEYSKLFERDRFGISSSTMYLSRGDWIQNAAQYGIFDNTSYAIEGSYFSFNGQQVNNDLEQYLASLRVKQNLTPYDSVYLQGMYSHAKYGDLAQYFDPHDANPLARFKETQEPILLAGYHHEWAPGSHTLFLGGRLQDTLEANNPLNQAWTVLTDDQGKVVGGTAARGPNGETIFPFFPRSTLDYRSEFEAYTAELQHIWQAGPHALIVGGRYQKGDFETTSRLGPFVAPGVVGMFSDGTVITNFNISLANRNTTTNRIDPELERWSAYSYYHLQAADLLHITIGASYEELLYPDDFRNPPFTGEQNRVDKLSPKAGFMLTPMANTTIRGAYTRSLGGASFDQSFRLEPSQVGGFNQAFRSLIPESVAGSVAGATFETWGLALDQKFGHGTYLGVEGTLLNSKASRDLGAFAFNLNDGALSLTELRDKLDYDERDLIVTVNQLIAQNWSVGARYRLSDAELKRNLPGLPLTLIPEAQTEAKALLHQLTLSANFYHRTGFFSTVEGVYWNQHNRGNNASLGNQDFWQANAYIGYRFPHRVAELRLGLLNITDQDYRLNPLNLYPDLPRDRTVLVSLRFNF